MHTVWNIQLITYTIYANRETFLLFKLVKFDATLKYMLDEKICHKLTVPLFPNKSYISIHL